MGDDFLEVTAEDYRLGGGVEPVADPTMTTDMQRLGRASLLMSFKEDPLVDQVEIRRRYFEAANIDRIDDLFVQPDPAAAQMAMARNQAELGKTRAQELEAQTQAFLNMAKARQIVDSKQEGFIEAQLTFLRLHIEALNTSIKAAAVDHKFHDTNMWGTVEHAKALASQEAQPGSAAPTPGPQDSDFPAVPDPLKRPPPGNVPGVTPPQSQLADLGVGG